MQWRLGGEARVWDGEAVWVKAREGQEGAREFLGLTTRTRNELMPGVPVPHCD